MHGNIQSIDAQPLRTRRYIRDTYENDKIMLIITT